MRTIYSALHEKLLTSINTLNNFNTLTLNRENFKQFLKRKL